MLVGCVFEKQEITIGSGVIATSPGTNMSIIKVGGASDEDGQGFHGIVLNFFMAVSGGSALSVALNMQRSFDGVTADDQEFQLVNFLGGGVGIGNWYQTVMYPAVPADSGLPGCGYAMRVNLIKIGDRTVTATVKARRWRYLFGA